MSSEPADTDTPSAVVRRFLDEVVNRGRHELIDELWHSAHRRALRPPRRHPARHGHASLSSRFSAWPARSTIHILPADYGVVPAID